MGNRPVARVIRTPRPSLRWLVELLWQLATQRINLRYKETFFGLGWIFLQPVALTMIFTYIFQRFAQVPSGDVPYPLFTAIGLVAWSLTALVVNAATTSLSGQYVLLRRAAVPRTLFPLSTVVASLADLGVMAVLLVALFAYYHAVISWTALWALGVLVIQLALLTGVGCLVALASVFVRDVGHAAPSLLQMWFFASPVFYPSSMVPDEFRVLSIWNPMTGLIESYRAVLLLGQPPPWDLFAPAVAVSCALLVAGVLAFRLVGHFVVDLV